MNPLIDIHNTQIYHADWRDLCRHVYRMERWPNALFVDAPYSERTHKGHNECESQDELRKINYNFWTPDDVFEFVHRWHPIVRGWFVSITDYDLSFAWCNALKSEGRYVFSPLPFVAPGSRIRMFGDGPSSWTCWVVVARPMTKEFLSWGTTDGAYILPPGMGVKMPVVGGKPPWLMCRLAEDYSRPGDLIIDPTCGGGTTGIGAIRTGRHCILGDKLQAHLDIATEWVRNPFKPAPGTKEDKRAEQHTLFGV